MAEVIINGSEGRIETRYHKNENPYAPIAVVLHPHPLYGGTMNNKVTYNMYQAMVRNGFTVARFNFRGVGRSQGTYDEGLGEMTDAATVMDWMQIQNPDACACWMSGFSFGAWICMQLLMRRPEIDGFIAVSPPANMYDFSFLSPCPSPGLVIQGNKDDVVPEDAVSKLMNKLSNQKGGKVDYDVVADADHYFRNQLTPLNDLMDNYIQSRAHEFSQRRRTKPDKKRRQLPRG